MIIITGPVKGSGAGTLIKLPPAEKIRFRGDVRYCCKGPDIAFDRHKRQEWGWGFGGPFVGLINPPVVSGLVIKGQSAIGNGRPRLIVILLEAHVFRI